MIGFISSGISWHGNGISSMIFSMFTNSGSRKSATEPWDVWAAVQCEVSSYSDSTPAGSAIYHDFDHLKVWNTRYSAIMCYTAEFL